MSDFVQLHAPFNNYVINSNGVVRDAETWEVVVPYIDFSGSPRITLRPTDRKQPYVRPVARYVYDIFGPEPLSVDEKVYYRDGNPANLNIENLYVKSHYRPFAPLYPTKHDNLSIVVPLGEDLSGAIIESADLFEDVVSDEEVNNEEVNDNEDVFGDEEEEDLAINYDLSTTLGYIYSILELVPEMSTEHDIDVIVYLENDVRVTLSITSARDEDCE